MLRYLIELLPFHTAFPMATFLINLGGSFIMGCFVGAVERNMASERTMTVLRVGFCGGFTTLSTFGVETITLFENDRHMIAYAYMLATFAACFLGIWAGRMIVRHV
ncbi:fluoride efflux transporter CrcB [Selenomonas sp. TAMA-11512]|nr:fluoride efflux transporter CrcB [Selenomonas sp. TAMA-11512]